MDITVSVVIEFARTKFVALLVLLSIAVAGCLPAIPPDALQLQPESFALRQLQTRRFDTSEEKNLLIAGAGVLQDLGFSIDESESSLGLIVGSKQRDAVETGQVIGAILLGALLKTNVPWDSEQKIRVSLVSRPSGPDTVNFRVTFQRVIWNSQGMISRSESLEDPELYQEFFDKLSKAVFLEAQQI